MANVTVTRVEVAPDGETATVTGTVNGIAVTAQGWVSAVTGMTGPQRLVYAATLLRDAWRHSNPPAPTVLPVTGSTTLPD